jgi:DNA repair ATPase RecN
VISYCGTIECTVVSSNLVTKTGDAAPSGSIALRVSPGDVKKLFDQVEKHGQIVQHATESEDKTTAVLDTEARIKNLTSFRDSLRSMQGKPSVSVKDLVEIQQQLIEVQSQLDSETAQRKILVNETEKVAVDITFGAERGRTSRSAWTPIWDALRESGSDLAASVA